MNWKVYLGISAFALLVIILLGVFQTAPGYMDAEYYYSMGLRIANRKGLTEPFIWNYLTSVETIPHPGFAYWMPLPAFISAGGIWISGLDSFTGAKLLPILIAACVPAVTVKISWELTGKVSAALLAGFLSVFPVFYSVFLGTTDSFGITMLLGGLFFLVASGEDTLWKYIAMGGLAGLMHLTRADGLLWLIAGIYCSLLVKKKKTIMALAVIVGYLVLMTPWLGRNLTVFGELMPPGTSKAFWLREYNDLYNFDPERLTFELWLSQGWSAIIKNYQAALFANLKNILLVQGQVILTPFIAIGAWKYRRDRAVQGLFLVWVSIFLLMSIVFPFAGIRGGYTHSTASFQPLLWALAGSGFTSVICWGVKRRNWVDGKASLTFGTALVLLIAISSLFIFHSRVIGEDFKIPVWQSSYQKAIDISDSLRKINASPNELIMINNPPGFYAASGRSSIVIPNGGVAELLAAADAYQARYLVLESNHPPGLAEIYAEPDNEPRLKLLARVNDALIFRIPE